MNLFRSEEHARNWSGYESASDAAILPVARWAGIFSADLFRHRRDADYLSKIRGFMPDFAAKLQEFGGGGPFWER